MMASPEYSQQIEYESDFELDKEETVIYCTYN
jgi:hypothetical protein